MIRAHGQYPPRKRMGRARIARSTAAMPQPIAVRLCLTVALPSFTIWRRGSASPLIFVVIAPESVPFASANGITRPHRAKGTSLSHSLTRMGLTPKAKTRDAPVLLMS